MFDKVKEVLIDELGVSEEEVTLDAQIVEDLGADSLAVMQIVMVLEEEFGVTVPEEDIFGLKTVQDIVNYIESHK